MASRSQGANASNTGTAMIKRPVIAVSSAAMAKRSAGVTSPSGSAPKNDSDESVVNLDVCQSRLGDEPGRSQGTIATMPDAWDGSSWCMQPKQSGLPQSAHTTAAGTSTSSEAPSSLAGSEARRTSSLTEP